MVAPSSLAIAYLDPTALIPIVFGEESAGAATQERLNLFPVLVSSNLLEAELRGRFEREGQLFDLDWLSGIEWVQPRGSLSSEMDRIQAFASLSPIRMWHLANAVYFADRLSLTHRRAELAFITLDEQQETVARDLSLLIP